MTRTADTVVEPATTSASPDPISTKPHRNDVIGKIMEETGCDREQADTFLRWIQSTIGGLRSAGKAIHYLTVGEMRRRHAILNAIAPDDTVAKPGSAHDLVQRFVLNPGRGELALTHSKRTQHHRTYCSVEVGVMTVTVG